MRVISALASSGPDAWRMRLAVLLLAAGTAWAALLWWAPVALAGRGAGRLELGMALASYAAGRSVCHQQPARSFAVRDVRQPVCARCSGLYLGAPAGVALGLASARRRRRRGAVSTRSARRALLWAAAPTLASIAIEWSRLGQPGNGARFLLALPAGAAVGWVTASALLGHVSERVE